MTNEEVLDKIKMIMDKLNITDEDVRQDIYLNALQNPSLCVDYDTILVELINPVAYNHFNELQEINKKFISYSSLDKINKDHKITKMIEDINIKKKQLQKIYDIAAEFGQTHLYIINERFLNQTDLDDIAVKLNISRDMVESIILDVISDIKSVLNKSNS